MISPTGRRQTLAAVRPNVGIAIAYRAKLDALIENMHRSLMWWIGACYRRNEPEIAKLALDAIERLGEDAGVAVKNLPILSVEDGPDAPRHGAVIASDASPAKVLNSVFDRLRRRWLSRFDDLAPDMARRFATQAKDRSDAALRESLRRAGMTVKFTMTRATNDAYQAVIAENVGLIRSIAEQHLTQVQGEVMRSVQAGRDLGALAQTIERQYGVTRRRAALIARDQNNKATAVIQRVRQQELGIQEAVWLHSAGGKEPRPSHVKAGREREVYKIAEGWLDPHMGKRIWPGELINCRCVSRPVLPGTTN